MIQIGVRHGGLGTSDGFLTNKAASRDDESKLAATLRTTLGDADATAPVRRRATAPRLTVRKGVDAQSRLVADEMERAIEARLPGRIRDLQVAVEQAQFVLNGVASSYYVKQMAQHLAMNAMDAHLLGRLVNEIEVRAVR